MSMHPGASSSSTRGATMDERLLKAAKSANITEMHDLVKDENPAILLGTTSQGSTCLHISSMFGHLGFSMAVVAVSEPLLSTVNSYEETPLIVAVKSGHVVMATTLLHMYIERGLQENILNLDINGDTALHHAIRQGHRQLALDLIPEEPNLSRIDNNYNESPMYIAVMRGFDDVFQILWNTPDSSAKGPYGDNALHAAVRNANQGERTRKRK